MPLAQSIGIDASYSPDTAGPGQGCFFGGDNPPVLLNDKGCLPLGWQITVTIYAVSYVVPGKEQTDGECLLRDLYSASRLLKSTL